MSKERLINNPNVEQYLQKTVGEGKWTLQATLLGGTTSERYIGKSLEITVFVRVGIDPKIVSPLSKAGVTPPLLTEEPINGKPCYVQEFITAELPTVEWNTQNWRVTAEKIKTMQQLPELSEALPEQNDPTYKGVFTRYIDELKDLSKKIPPDDLSFGRVGHLLNEFSNRAENIEGEGLVPCHGDLHPENVLTKEKDSYLIDWESVHLSDPMRDVAHMIWRLPSHVPAEEQAGYFGFDLTDPQQYERFRLHIATRALQIYLFCYNSGAGHKRGALQFLEDAEIAMAHKK